MGPDPVTKEAAWNPLQNITLTQVVSVVCCADGAEPAAAGARVCGRKCNIAV
jgi:hypothetical protein